MITVRPSGAASRAAKRAVDPIVVGDDQVRQAPARGRVHDVHRVRARQSNDADVWQCRSMNALVHHRASGHWESVAATRVGSAALGAAPGDVAARER